MDAKAIAKSKASANQFAKSLSIPELEKAIANLSAALKSAKAKEASKETKRKAAALKKVKAMISDMGLSAEDVAALSSQKGVAKKKKPQQKNKVAPKYEYEANGTIIRWTGRGRMPVVFREFVEKGGSLEDCLIKK